MNGFYAEINHSGVCIGYGDTFPALYLYYHQRLFEKEILISLRLLSDALVLIRLWKPVYINWTCIGVDTSTLPGPYWGYQFPVGIIYGYIFPWNRRLWEKRKTPKVYLILKQLQSLDGIILILLCNRIHSITIHWHTGLYMSVPASTVILTTRFSTSFLGLVTISLRHLVSLSASPSSSPY